MIEKMTLNGTCQDIKLKWWASMVVRAYNVESKLKYKSALIYIFGDICVLMTTYLKTYIDIYRPVGLHYTIRNISKCSMYCRYKGGRWSVE